MREIRSKTKQEQIEAEESYFQPRYVTVYSTGKYFWVCDICRVAYFGSDIIIETYDGRMRCPNILHHLFKKDTICNNSISGGDEGCFNKYYKFKQ